MKKKKKKRSCWAAEPELERKKTVWLEPELETMMKKKKRTKEEDEPVWLVSDCRNRNRAWACVTVAGIEIARISSHFHCSVHRSRLLEFWSSRVAHDREKKRVCVTDRVTCVGNFNLGRILLILDLGCPVQVQQTPHQKWSFLNFLRAARGPNGLRAFSGRAKKP